MGQAKKRREMEEAQRKAAEARRLLERQQRNAPKGRRGWTAREVAIRFVKGEEERTETYLVYPDGSIYCLYERGGLGGNHYHTAGVTVARFSLQWLTDGQDTLSQGQPK